VAEWGSRGENPEKRSRWVKRTTARKRCELGQPRGEEKVSQVTVKLFRRSEQKLAASPGMEVNNEATDTRAVHTRRRRNFSKKITGAILERRMW